MPAAALLLAALSACSPSTTTPPAATTAATSQAPTETATPSAEPTDSATAPPERPDAMSTPSADGAAAAASYFLQLYAYTYSTGNLTEWNSLSAEDCEFCISVRNDVESIFRAGGRGAGSATTINSATGQEIEAGNTYGAIVEVTQGPSSVILRDGSEESSGNGGDFSMYFAMWWRDGWIVREVDVTRLEG